MYRLRLSVVTGLAIVMGCSSTEGTAPGSIESTGNVPTHAVVLPASPTILTGSAGDPMSTPPSVNVYLSPGAKPVAGASVRFTFSDGRAPDYVTATQSNGMAVLQNAGFDSKPGKYNIIANVEGVGSLTFSVTSIGGKVIATYDLHSMAGIPGPPFYFGGQVLGITGGHYKLFDDGTYQFGYDTYGATSWNSREPYRVRESGALEFYLDPASAPQSSFYASRGYLFSVGTITGNVMKVIYEDPVDFEDEEYVRSK